ncbi:cyclic nucleotide-binding domain-containing protein [Anaerotignum propionicum]|uniref:cyclic nucleotide-binding domain-containing protein n=1 Tax=Anaerotignum propionicum TaxID=28446 RepID=UPI00210B80EA|nr:cyclic nucleotide-binding domain-containing protein [Anaerotignum propionicum]MCQ4935252.1 cyclic nucleotide-binding domain-containing protein [Anaerotignum propionicum]
MVLKNEIPSMIFENGVEKCFSKEENIYKMNSRVTYCYFILSGVAKIYIDHSNGRRSILDFAGQNDWLGELSLFSDEANIKENKVLQEIKCLEFDLNVLQKLCKEDASVSFYFASYISNKLLSRSYRMSESLNYSLNKRLATFILQYQHNGRYEIPHTDVSEYLNVSYRHVLYVMKQFREWGIIEKDRGKGYVTVNIEKLKELQDK